MASGRIPVSRDSSSPCGRALVREIPEGTLTEAQRHGEDATGVAGSPSEHSPRTAPGRRLERSAPKSCSTWQLFYFEDITANYYSLERRPAS